MWPLLMVGGVALNASALALLAWWLGGSLSFGESTAGEVPRPAAPTPSEPQIASSAPSAEDEPTKSPPAAPKADVEADLPSKKSNSAAPQREERATAAAETTQRAGTTGQAEAGPSAKSGRQEASAASAATPGIETKPQQRQLAIAEPQDLDPPPAAMPTHDESSAAPSRQAARSPEAELPPLKSAEPNVGQSNETENDAYASLPMRRSLSYAIQTKLPDLSILVHVYGEEPRDRFVIIQNRKYREGDELADDLALEAITPSGAVLRYKDTAFRIEP